MHPQDYHMHSFGLTDSGSILTNAAFSMRFMFPLGLNLLMLFVSESERNANHDQYPYLSLFRDMSVLPLFGQANVFLPTLVIVFCAATYFNVYGKIMKKLRISRFEFGDPASDRNGETRHFIQSGKGILNKFKKEMANDPDKRAQFEQYIEERFRHQNAIRVALSPFIANRLSRKAPPHHDFANVSLMNQSPANDGRNNLRNDGRKLQFVELEESAKQ